LSNLDSSFVENYDQRFEKTKLVLYTGMSNKMKIGIIGAGQIGGTLIRRYTNAGHSVKMTNSSGPGKLKNLALETGALPVTPEEVVKDVDVIIITIPSIGILNLPQDLFKNTPANTAIIDTCNYYPIRDGLIEEIEKGMLESVWVSNHIQRSVIKVYNSIFSGSLIDSALPQGASSRLALPVSGDDKNSKELVSILVNDSGFDSLDAGSLQDSWRQQPGSPVYCTDLTLPQLKKSLAKARKELLPERRQLGLAYIMEHSEQWRDCVNYNRKIYESVLE
jgi:predicted dinucleotide-binding enzyme